MLRLNVGDKREGIKRFSGRGARRSHCWIRMCLHSKVMQQSMFSQPAWQMANRTTLSQSRILMGEFLFLSKATGSKKRTPIFYRTVLKTFFLPILILQALRVTHIANNSPTLCFYCTQPLGLDRQDWPVPSGKYHFCDGLKQLRQHGWL